MSSDLPVSNRVDARRSRERLVDAARELFALEGVDVPVREVARHAGVGIGTLYRHFPSREDLVDAVLGDAFEQLVALAESALAEPDPWTGFARFLEDALLLHARNRGLRDVVETQTRGTAHATVMRSRVQPLVAELVDRAQEQGTLRADFAPQDLPLLLWAGDRVVEMAGHVAPEIWRRYLGFVLDGLRGPGAQPLAQRPLTDIELQRVGARKPRHR